ncbi:hypothetical protein HanIR_Chr10g0459091 [Helianthus annuus]|nr:hypothetical protein HanIR_Chr10g0459091 [Helianthus annuus]
MHQKDDKVQVIDVARGGKMDGLDWIGCWVKMGLGWVWIRMSLGLDGFGSGWVENKSIMIKTEKNYKK